MDKSTEELLAEIIDAAEALHPYQFPHIEMQPVADGKIYIRVSSCHNGEEIASKDAHSIREAIAALHREVTDRCRALLERMAPVVSKVSGGFGHPVCLRKGHYDHNPAQCPQCRAPSPPAV